MKTGYVERKVIKCLIVGAARVGKTSIKHRLLNEKLPEKHVSTDVAEKPTVAISVSRAIMKTDAADSWCVIHNDEDLIKMIGKIIKAQAQQQEKSKAMDTAPDEISPVTGTAFESRTVNSAEMVEPVSATEIQEDSIQKDIIRAIMEAEGKYW